MNTTPAIIIKTRFILPNTSNFQNYINYIDRANVKSKVNDFKLYQDYMDDDKKTTSLFTETENNLTKESKVELKELYQQAQNNNSIMWQDVISFDNDWLADQGIYSYKDKSLDENKIKEATRRAMDEMAKKENMEGTIVWSAAIHYNTDNIHVHVSTVQPVNPRERGKRKQSTLDNMKTKVAHCLMDRSQQNKELNNYIREEVIAKKKVDKFKTFGNRKMYKNFKEIYKILPPDKRQWSYNYNTMKDVRPPLDKLTDKYIEKNFKVEHKDFLSNLDKEVLNYKKVYGENSNYKKYKEDKIRDLYTRMGNTILKELREHDRELILKANSKKTNLVSNVQIRKAYFKINRYMKDNYDSMKNQREFERNQRQSDYEREM